MTDPSTTCGTLASTSRADPTIEARMVAVAEALAAAHRCRAMDVVAVRR